MHSAMGTLCSPPAASLCSCCVSPLCCGSRSLCRCGGVASRRRCESLAASDHSAALLIQRRFRGWSARRWLALLARNATRIQACFRGHLGRRSFLLAARAREQAASRSFFESRAIVIQKHVRGYLSRKYAQDLYARRNYIAAVSSRGDSLLESSSRAQESQLLYLSSQSESRRSQSFESLVRNAHHLVSTASIPSVFVQPLQGTTTTAFDISMEEHIQEAFRNRQRELRKMRVGSKLRQTCLPRLPMTPRHTNASPSLLP